MFRAERRLEAATYLGEGHATRLAIESKRTGWTLLSAVARTWQPSRLKGIQIAPEHGTPFLTATQVFDVRPIPRKWLAIDRTPEHRQRLADHGEILLTRSGNVGRATLAQLTIKDVLISDDLLRFEFMEKEWWGWIYAYLRAPTVRKMMKAAEYGHIIKHLETHHLNSLPVVRVDGQKRAQFGAKAREILDLRDRAYLLTAEAEQLFEQYFGAFEATDLGETGFIFGAGAIFSARRRMDAWHHNPAVMALEDHLARQARSWNEIGELGFDVWLPTRFRRVAARDGVEFLDSSDLFEINPDITKRIADGDFRDPHNGRVERGWVLLARSGQIYGLNGSAMLSGQLHENKVISDDIIRIAPRDPRCRSGYLLVAMTHPTLGRPRVKALPYGSSIPHIEVEDVRCLSIPRLAERAEEDIADRAEEAARLRDRADELETRLAESADAEVERFTRGG
ncbi:MAG: hypothetical protein OXH45_11995 [Gammaproteobacteria bacterium]|nr:hypothetical protein [Gammaproteobacteria bacterium]